MLAPGGARAFPQLGPFTRAWPLLGTLLTKPVVIRWGRDSNVSSRPRRHLETRKGSRSLSTDHTVIQDNLRTGSGSRQKTATLQASLHPAPTSAPSFYAGRDNVVGSHGRYLKGPHLESSLKKHHMGDDRCCLRGPEMGGQGAELLVEAGAGAPPSGVPTPVGAG